MKRHQLPVSFLILIALAILSTNITGELQALPGSRSTEPDLEKAQAHAGDAADDDDDEEEEDDDVSADDAEHQILVRARASFIELMSTELQLSIVTVLEQGDSPLFLVEGDDDTTPQELIALLLSFPEVMSAELARSMALPGNDDESSSPILGSDFFDDLALDDEISTPFLSSHQLASGWAGYISQTPLSRVQLHAAHSNATDLGPITIAFIDTGVDPDHPLLAPALTEGYDFIENRAGMASEWDSLEQEPGGTNEVSDALGAVLDQSLAVILEGNGHPVPVNPRAQIILQQSLAVILEDVDLPDAFGHGTMVAGLLRLVAPNALLMPLKAFDSEGEAHLFNIVSAIYYAVDHGANVINMSFSTEEPSPELEQAIEYAFDHEVVCIAAAGNRGEEMLVYPAAYDLVLGVASTSNLDLLSVFSNYGTDVAALAAPGEGLITTFPGGHYAAGWGTSFSAPLVAGAAALLSAEIDSRESALMDSSLDLDWSDDYLTSGRLDILNAVISGGDG